LGKQLGQRKRSKGPQKMGGRLRVRPRALLLWLGVLAVCKGF